MIVSVPPSMGKSVCISVLANMLTGLATHTQNPKYNLKKIYIIHANEHLSTHSYTKYSNKANSNTNYGDYEIIYLTYD